MFPNGISVKFGNFANSKLDALDTFTRFASLRESFCKDGLSCIKFMHVRRLDYFRVMDKLRTVPPVWEGLPRSSVRSLHGEKRLSLRTVYKPHSVHDARSTTDRHCAIISLGGASPRRSMRPTRDWLSHLMGKHV